MNTYNSLLPHDFVPLNKFISQAYNTDEQPVGWPKLYMQFSQPASRKLVQNTVRHLFSQDEPDIDPVMQRKADYYNEMVQADMAIYNAHQEYLNNTPVVRVPVSAQDFNDPAVQEKIASLPNREEVVQAIENFENSLAQSPISIEKKSEIRDQFYKRILTMDAAVVQHIAKDEVGQDVKNILQLLSAQDLGGDRANVIQDPIGGGDPEQKQDYEEDQFAPINANARLIRFFDYRQDIASQISKYNMQKHVTAENKIYKSFVVDGIKSFGNMPISPEEAESAILIAIDRPDMAAAPTAAARYASELLNKRKQFKDYLSYVETFMSTYYGY